MEFPGLGVEFRKRLVGTVLSQEISRMRCHRLGLLRRSHIFSVCMSAEDQTGKQNDLEQELRHGSGLSEVQRNDA